jgi:hypothetical protein
MPLNKIKFLILMSTFLAGLWLAACKSTPTPSTPALPQPEATETKDTSHSTSSAPAESAQPEVQEKSKTGRATSPETAAAQTPEPKQKSQERQTAATGAAETQSQETAQRTPQSRETTPQTAEAKLAKARDDLRVSEATEKRIAAELEKRKQSSNASAEDIRNHEAYLERVQAMVAENRKMVEEMEKAYAEHPHGRKTSSESSKLPDQQIPEEQVRDPVAELDRQLNAALTEFDGTLLKEMEKIQTASTAKMQDLAQEAAEAAKRLKGKGGEASKQGEDGDKESENEKKSESDKGEDSDDKKMTGSEKDSEDEPREIESSKESKSTAGKGKGGYGKEDEDIVARQLREAAENETDPELKKKLWAEYEEYMKNTQ